MIEINYNNRKEFFKSLGLVLVIIGMQLNTAIKNVILGLDIVEIIMFFSVLFLIDYESLFKARLKKRAVVLLFFSACLIFISITSENATTQLIIFQCYIFALIYSFATHIKVYEFKYFNKIFFYISGFISAVICFQATNGFKQLIFSYHETGKLWLSEGGDPVSMARALVLTVIAVLLYKNKKSYEKILSLVFLVFSIIGLLSFSNRSSIICVVLITIFGGIKSYGKRLTGTKMLLGIIVIAVFFVVYYKVPYFNEKIQSVYNSIVSGISTFIGIGNVGIVDSSANTRVQILDSVLAEFSSSNNVILNCLLGMGYNHTYVDRPVFQIFFDLGCIALSIYFFYLILIPLIELLRVTFSKTDLKSYSYVYLTFVLFSIQTLLDQIYCGLPYYYYLWIPGIYFACCRTSIYSSTADFKLEQGNE